MSNQDIQFKDWVLKLDGDLIHESGYLINGDRLKESQWISQIREKTWADMNTFLDAYFFALGRIDVKELTIDIY